MSPATFSPKSLRTPSAITTLLLSTILLSGCALPKFSAAEKEIADTLTSSKYQPATREFRDNIETQDLLAQAAFWSREHNLNPGDLEAAIKLAAAIRKMGNPAQAIEITQQTRALYPRDPYLAAEYAAALIASERGGDAMETLDTALRTSPGYARLWSLKGAALDQLEDYELARKHYAKALQITPYDPNVLANIGLSYALSGDVQTAEEWLRRAANIPGAGASVRQNLAIVLQLQGKNQEADKLIPNLRQAALGSLNTYNGRSGSPSQPHQTQPQHARPQHSQSSRHSHHPSSSASTATPHTNYQAKPPQTRAYQNPTTRPSQQGSSHQSYNGSPYSSASDAARAAAQNQTRKREIRPVTNPTSEQKSILDQLARNVGPKSSLPNTLSRSEPSGYYPGRNTRAAPPPTANPDTQASSSAYPSPLQYGNNYGQASQATAAPTLRRGPARQR